MNPATKLGGRVIRKLSGLWKGVTGGQRFGPTRGNGTQPRSHAAQQKDQSGALDILHWQRAAECWETARAIVVKVEIPRTGIGDLAISVYPGALRVRAAKRSMGKHRGRFFLLIERAFGRLERSIPLPINIDPTQADLSYQDGVLTVIVPKTEVSPPARLPIP
jgi:HSP20 family molecular chaperone IbpA